MSQLFRNGKMMDVKKLIQSELVLALVRSFLARTVGAFGTLFLGIVLGRLYGPTGVGVFALVQSVILGSAIIARYGQNNTLMRYVGQNKKGSYVGMYLIWAVKKSLLFSMILSSLVYCSRFYVASVLDIPEMTGLLAGASFAIIPFTLAFVLSGFMKGIRKVATSNLLENGAVSLLAAVIILFFNFYAPSNGIVNTAFGFALAAWLVFLQGVFQAWLWFKVVQLDEPAPVDFVSRIKFNETSWDFFISSLALFMQQVVGIWIAGFMLTESDLGLFKSAERMAMLIGFVLMIVNSVFPPRFAEVYGRGDLERLKVLARMSAFVAFCFSFPLVMFILIFPEWILGLFGPGFSSAAGLLRLLAIGQAINVVTGSVSFLLNMTGHERVSRNIAVTCNAVGLVLIVLLVPLFGVWGAATALFLVLVCQNLIALYVVWLKLGFFVYPRL
jgi:O-antigen/teichoic acid export membrane protein